VPHPADRREVLCPGQRAEECQLAEYQRPAAHLQRAAALRPVVCSGDRVAASHDRRAMAEPSASLWGPVGWVQSGLAAAQLLSAPRAAAPSLGEAASWRAATVLVRALEPAAVAEYASASAAAARLDAAAEGVEAAVAQPDVEAAEVVVQLGAEVQPAAEAVAEQPSAVLVAEVVARAAWAVLAAEQPSAGPAAHPSAVAAVPSSPSRLRRALVPAPRPAAGSLHALQRL
jgi:hypothetical protein